MILVLEGPNGAGKSTLFDELLVDMNQPLRYIHNGRSDTPLADYVAQGSQALTSQTQGVSTVIDRFNVGEQVYPFVYNRPRLIEPLEDHLMVSALGKLGVRWLILCPPIARLVLAHRTRGEAFSVDTLEAEREGFIAYYNRLHPSLRPYFSLVVDDATIPQLLNAVRKLTER